ncbi:MAG: hypothetical protein OHK0028_08500 [Deltaproteobacteria bacterium]
MVLRATIALAAIVPLLSCSGCIVTTSTYETKVREVESLRDAYSSLHREKGRLAAENAALAKQAADRKAEVEALSARVGEKEESVRRLREEISELRNRFEGTRLTREQFVNELLEKEKATGKRLQELSSRADACEAELAREKRESAGRDGEIAELRKRLEPKEDPPAR